MSIDRLNCTPSALRGMRLVVIPLLTMVALLAAAVQSTGQTTTGTYPGWWYDYGVLSTGTANDYAAANQGQAKNIAVAAVSELDNDLAQFGGAGPVLDNLAGWLLTSDTLGGANDYAAVNLGQLKNLALPFFDRLLALGYYGPPLNTGTAMTSGTYPWVITGLPANDYAAANIGQLKYLFSFDVNYSASGDGIPDWWLRLYGLPLTTSTTAFVPWSGGQVSYLEAYEYGLSPYSYYNSETPNLTIVAGASQTGSEGGFLSSPLVVSVTDTGGDPMIYAPVIFTVTGGGGQLETSISGRLTTSGTALTDPTGSAQVFFQLPSVSSTCEITVTTGTGTGAQTVIFTEYSGPANGSYYSSPFAPSNVVGTVNSDGSETVTWQNNDPQDPVYIYQMVASGSWEVTGTLQAGTTSYTIEAPLVGTVEIGNTYSPGGNSGTPPGGGNWSGSAGGGSGGGGGGGSGPSSPGSFPFAAVPVQNYALLDISGSTTSTAVSAVALDDSDNVAFTFTSGNVTLGIETTDEGDETIGNFAELNSYTWRNGTAVQGTVISGTAQCGVAGYPDDLWLRGSPPIVVTNGNMYGGEGAWNFPAGVTGTGACENDPLASIFIASSGGSQGEDLTSPNSLYTPGGVFGEQGTGVESVSNAGVILGNATHLLVSGSTAHTFAFILSGGTCTAFDSGSYAGVTIPPGLVVDSVDDFVIAGSLQPQVNDHGWAIGLDADTGNPCVWMGQQGSMVDLDPMGSATAISESGQVIGVTFGPNGAVGYLWTIGAGVQLISQLIPPAYQNEVWNINPLAISGTDAYGNVSILCGASYQADQYGDQGYGGFLLTLTTSGTNQWQLISIPSNVNIDFTEACLNAPAVIAGAGSVTTTDAGGNTTTSAQSALVFPAVKLILLNGQTPDFDKTVVTNIISSPENPNYSNDVWAQSSLNQQLTALGTLAMGAGREDYPLNAYTNSIMVAAEAPPNFPNLYYKWHRTFLDRSWYIKKVQVTTNRGLSGQWLVQSRTSYSKKEDITSPNYENTTPSSGKHEFYAYDNSALAYHSSGDEFLNLNDYIHEEKAFVYQVSASTDNVNWTVVGTINVGQVITVKKNADLPGGTAAADLVGVENTNTVGTIDPIITPAKVQNILGVGAKFTILPGANPAPRILP